MGQKPPTIALLHQLPRSGGTIVNRTLGSMSGVCLLSEIHPATINAPNAFNPLLQAFRWFELLNTAEMRLWAGRMEARDCDFTKAMKCLAQKALERKASLVVREFSHRDFIKTPRTRPGYQSVSAGLLANQLAIRRFALVRHPARMWLSLESYPLSRGRCDLDQFLHGYRQFAEMAVTTGFCRYEDFCRQPDDSLAAICSGLDISYDSGWTGKWKGYRKLTGDDSRDPDAPIAERPGRDLPQGLSRHLSRSTDYRIALDLLGYKHPGSWP
jgi:hypothetical protein